MTFELTLLGNLLKFNRGIIFILDLQGLPLEMILSLYLYFTGESLRPNLWYYLIL